MTSEPVPWEVIARWAMAFAQAFAVAQLERTPRLLSMKPEAVRKRRYRAKERLAAGPAAAPAPANDNGGAHGL